VLTSFLKSGVLKVGFRFLRTAIFPRITEIIFTQETLLSITIGIAAFFASSRVFAHAAKLSDLTIGFVGYAAIALGFCVAGITIALTLPDRDFMQRLATLRIPEKEGDALASLLFVFVWTAFVHWCSIAIALIFLLLFGHIEATDLVDKGRLPRILLGAGASIAAYTLLQFLITTLTLWQVGSLYIDKLKKDASEDAEKAAKAKLPSAP